MQHSAGIALIRYRQDQPEIFLVHPGGPFWVHKDDGAWGIPKGMIEHNEDASVAAVREFHEEVGITLPYGVEIIPITPFAQSKHKTIHAFVAQCDLEISEVHSNLTPEGFPEIDKGQWFSLSEAVAKMIPGQRPLLERIQEIL